jgi:hypothetical protein
MGERERSKAIASDFIEREIPWLPLAFRMRKNPHGRKYPYPLILARTRTIFYLQGPFLHFYRK